MNGQKKRFLSVVAVLAVPSLILAACGGAAPTASPSATPTRAPQTTATPAPTPSPTLAPTAAPPQPKYGGILQARVARDWASWDTYSALGGFSMAFTQQLLSNLIRFKKGSLTEIQGDTAESWDASGDGRVYTFKLRKGLAWSDGRPLTSTDVVYNFQRATDPRFTFNKERVASIATMETPDALTLRLTLKKVSVSFLPNIAGPFTLLYPAHIADMSVWQKSPVGSGPFVFKEYNKDVSYIYRKNPAYYLKDAAGRPTPYLDGIDYHVIADVALALAAFRTGQIHCGCGHDNDFLTDAQELLEKEIPGVRLKLITSGAMFNLQVNLQQAPFNNVAFRQALAIGWDKDKVASIDRRGKGYHPAPLLMAPEAGGRWGLPKEELTKIPGYNPDHSVDVRIAQGKFKESGINPNDVKLEILFSPFFGSLGELMATVMSELGVKATAFPPSPADFTKRKIDGTFDIVLTTNGISIDDPADQFVAEMVTGGSANFGKYSNARVDQLLVEQDAEQDPVKRRAMLWEAQRIILTEFPIIPFLWQGAAYGTRPEVEGWVHLPVNVHASMRLDEVWLSK